MTIQAHAEDADINVLMRRFGITGKMPDNPKIPTYGDFSQITDYRTALDAVRRAHEGFMEIPAPIRAQFDNDPQLFMEFCENPENLEAMRNMGLAKPKPMPATTTPTTPATPAAAGPSVPATPAPTT